MKSPELPPRPAPGEMTGRAVARGRIGEHTKSARLCRRELSPELVAGVEVELAVVRMEALIFELEALERREHLVEDRRVGRRRGVAECGVEVRSVGRGAHLANDVFRAVVGHLDRREQRQGACSASVAARPSQAKPPPGPGALMPSGLSRRSAYGGVYSL